MGASFTAPLAPVGGSVRDTINDALGAAPETLADAMKPLLDMDIHGLCEAYRRLAERSAEPSDKTKGGGPTAASVASDDLQSLLGLPVPAIRRIAAHRQVVPVVELLLVLALLSHTHAYVKARFIFMACECTWNGDLAFFTFRAIVAAFLRVICSLAQIPRAEFPKIATADVLARPLFAPYAPAMQKDSFVWLAATEGPVHALLRRFSRGALDQHFLLTPWPTQPCSQDLGSPAFSPSLSHSSSRDQDSPPTIIDSVLPCRREVRTPRKEQSLAASLYMVPPRLRPKSARPATASRRSVVTDSSKLSGSRRDARRTPTPRLQMAASPNSSNNAPPLEGLPRRKGYFQAVPSPLEQELMEELRHVQRRKADASKRHGPTGDLYDRERQLRAQIRKEVKDDSKRYHYRKQLALIRKGQVTLEATPPDRLWTASREHVTRGGELPYRCSEPLTPEKLQQSLLEQMAIKRAKSKVADGKDHRDKGEKPAKRLEETVELLGAMSPPVARRLTGPLGKNLRDEESSDEDSESSKASASNVSSKSRWRHGHTNGIKRADVLLAFEIFRKNYWDDSAAAAKTIPESAPTVGTSSRRDDDMEAILQESDKEYCGSHGLHYQDCKSHAMTLRQYLKTLFPGCNQGDMKQMLGWIEGSRNVYLDETPHRPESHKRQAEALREVIDLFDTIDKDGSGVVPLNAIEQFLCGELLTDREQRKKNEAFASSRSELDACSIVTYVDGIKDISRARFLTRTVEDREEWSVIVPDREARWAGLQQRFSVKEYKSMTDNVQSRNRQVTMNKVIGQRMEKLAKFLDEERCGGSCPPVGDAAEGSSSIEREDIQGHDLDIACMPNFNAAHILKGKDDDNEYEQIRLVRLYWRYLLGSAVQQSLRDGERCFNLRSDGQVDLVAFVCILAHDQVLGLLPKGEKPTAKSIRRLVYSHSA